MNNQEIEILKKAVNNGNIIWNPNNATGRKVVKIGPPPKLEPGDEPGECAYFFGGEYIALYENCDLADFMETKPIRKPPQPKKPTFTTSFIGGILQCSCGWKSHKCYMTHASMESDAEVHYQAAHNRPQGVKYRKGPTSNTYG